MFHSLPTNFYFKYTPPLLNTCTTYVVAKSCLKSSHPGNKHSMNNPGGYTAEVTNLSPIATEKELHHFFGLCGKIDRIQILRASEVASTAYVSFRSSHALEIAVFLNGAIIVDQPVCISRWEHYKDDDIWNQICWKSEEATHSSSIIEEASSDSGVGEQDGAEKVMSVVKRMLWKGYVVGKDGLERARALEQSHQVSASILKALSEAAEAAVEFGSQGMHY